MNMLMSLFRDPFQPPGSGEMGPLDVDLGISYGVVSDHPDGSFLDRCDCGDPFFNPLADCFYKSWESRSQVEGLSLRNPENKVRKRRDWQGGV